MILGVFGVLAVALFIGVMAVFASYATGLDPSKLEQFELSQGSSVMSSDGVELATFAAEERRVISFDNIPQVMADAQVAAEDRTFWTNPCIDFKGIVRAALQNFSASETVSGASTICQQLVRIRLFDADLLANPDRRWERKIKEAMLALQVGDAYPGLEGKQKLLEMYLNQVYYGNNAYGIWAAAHSYFDKDITSSAPEDQLTIGEAALLAGLVRAPSGLDPTQSAVPTTDASGATVLVVPPDADAIRVQGFVLDGMVATGAITPEERDEAAAQQIVLAPPRNRQYKAPHFVYAVRRAAAELLGDENLLDRGGLVITTSLDYNGYQVSAEKWAGVAYDMDRMTDEQLIAKYGEPALAWIKQLQGRNINNDALVTINYRTGAVLAYVGSANYYGEATDAHQPQYDVVGQAFRQSGSAFKPITYATGFERGTITPATMFMDVEGVIAEGYTVPNASGNERGPVRVRDALKYSWNIPVTKAQQLIGTQNVVDQAVRMGLEWDPRQEKEVAVPSLTLGTIGVHMLDLAGAYGALANGGMLAEPFLIAKITDHDGTVIYDQSTDAEEPERVLSEDAAYLVTDILADNTNPDTNIIWGRRFQLTTEAGRRPATLKTGTTNDFRDLQAFGYLAPDADPAIDEGAIITGVWVGNSDFTDIKDVFAADGPTFIWHDYMAEVTAANELPLREFPRPASIVSAEVDSLTGMLPGEFTTATVTEDFAAAHQPTQRDSLHVELMIEEATGKIWQPGCGDPASSAEPSASPGSEVAEEKVYLDFTDYEGSHPTWEEANRAWIERFRGKESAVPRSPSPAFDAPFAPTETCTPGEIPTSTPSPSPSPSPSPTPLPSPTPAPSPTPIVLPSLPIPTPSPSSAPPP
ncbi:MAG TPA: transglycosylase domain-containing protein [Candidatus Limnocylindria bacterium]|nr:transglycosylase domain-containing protein [Candidatus Limnocylindria bacterium]